MSPLDLRSSPLLDALQLSPRMPVLFLGHGSPLNAIEDNVYRQSWQHLGATFGQQYPVPQLILCISAHWLTQGWWLTAMPAPRTIHDFGGFPQALFDQQYPAPGAPEIAKGIAQMIHQPTIKLDQDEWGLDHGTWSVLKPMFPAAMIPVVQLSMDYHRPPHEHFALGQQLASLRERGVLIIGSGNIVHNLRAIQRGVASDETYDWALAFDQATAGHIRAGRLAALADFQQLGRIAELAHPTNDHYLPLLYAAGAVQADEPAQMFNENFQSASIAMRSVIWG